MGGLVDANGNIFGLDPKTFGLLGAGLGGIFGGLSDSGDTQGSQGYTGGIPDLTATRTPVPGAFGSTYTTPTGELAPRTPGSSGRRYFSDVAYTPVTDAAGLPTIMGAAEFEAANQAALDRQQELTNLGTGLLGIYGQNQASQATTGTTDLTGGATTDLTGGATTDLTGGATTDLTGGATTDLTGGATTTDTTLTGGATTGNEFDTFANSLRGRELTAADAAAIAASGYSLNDLASTLSTATMPIDALALRNFINTYTSGSTTTDDGKVGSTGMRNLLVNELGYTENADGTLTDPTDGTIYGLSADDTWAPRAATTTDTTLTGGATTGNEFDTFANSLRGRELTAADAAAIAASGYSLNDLASTLSTATMPIDALALRNFINTYTSGSTTTDDGKVGSTGMRNLLVNELGYTENADGTLTDPTDGTIYGLSADDTWVPQAATTTTDATGGITTDTTTTDAVDTLLNSTEQYMVASGGYTDNGDGTVTDNTNGYVYDNDTGEGFFPATDTTTTDTTGTGTTGTGTTGTTGTGTDRQLTAVELKTSSA